MSKLLNAKKSWEHLGIRRTSFYALIHSRQLPHVRIGSRILVDVDDLDAFIESRKVAVFDAKAAVAESLSMRRRTEKLDGSTNAEHQGNSTQGGGQ